MNHVSMGAGMECHLIYASGLVGGQRPQNKKRGGLSTSSMPNRGVPA